MAADPAERQWRIAAPVEEQKRLLAALHCLADSFRQGRRQKPARRRRRTAHVDGFKIGKCCFSIAAIELDSLVAALLRIDLTFDGRRGRGEHDRKAANMATHHGHIARIVENAVFLFVSRIMFFIDDDQPQFLEGQEKC